MKLIWLGLLMKLIWLGLSCLVRASYSLKTYAVLPVLDWAAALPLSCLSSVNHPILHTGPCWKLTRISSASQVQVLRCHWRKIHKSCKHLCRYPVIKSTFHERGACQESGYLLCWGKIQIFPLPIDNINLSVPQWVANFQCALVVGHSLKPLKILPINTREREAGAPSLDSEDGRSQLHRAPFLSLLPSKQPLSQSVGLSVPSIKACPAKA